MRRSFIACVLLLIVAPAVGALVADGPRVYRDHVMPHWFAGGTKFWYRNDLAGGRREFVLVDAIEGKRGPAFDHAKVAEALSRITAATVQPDRLPIDSVRFTDDGKTIRLMGNDSWILKRDDYELSRTSDVEDAAAPVQTKTRRADPASRRAPPDRSDEGIAAPSPDGRWEVFVRDANLWLRDRHSQEERALSRDASDNDTYHRDVYRQRAVEMRYTLADPPASLPEVYWSGDSRHLVAIRTHTVVGREVHYVESSPRDRLQPKLHAYPYLKAGDEIPVRKPHLFDVTAVKEVPLSDALFPTPWDVDDIRWAADSSRFTFVYNQRGHQELRLVAVDASTGNSKPIIDERSKTFIDYSGKMFVEYLDDSNEIVWMSERDGWNHLYLCDANTDQAKNSITRGEWVVRGVDCVNRQTRQIWFRAGGIRPGQDPYFVHYCRVNFDGSGLVVLTEGNGTHLAEFSPDRRFLIDTWSRVDSPPVSELRDAIDGRLVCKLEEADASEVLAAHRQLPEPFIAKGRDGQTDIYGIIVRPANFDASCKYPVIESIYAGPQDSYVPKSFQPFPPQHELADLGFVVVQIDGMGTSNRSKKFHDVCWKNLGDAGFPDRILWLKAAAAKYPQLDLKRVGIYGTSAGGQSALGGLLFHGDFYTCGVADSGCHDNRMDKIWWNEQWMGWPVGPEYAEQSNVTHAKDLRGPLLLMFGEEDENVDPASTLQVVNALIKADKNFELVEMPGHGHGVLGTHYGRKRMTEFFQRNLLHSP